MSKSKEGALVWKTAYEGLMWQMRQMQADLDEARTERDLAWKNILVLHVILSDTDVPRDEIKALVAGALAHWNLDSDPLWHEVLCAIREEIAKKEEMHNEQRTV